jgi:hypothetical protein
MEVGTPGSDFYAGITPSGFQLRQGAAALTVTEGAPALSLSITIVTPPTSDLLITLTPQGPAGARLTGGLAGVTVRYPVGASYNTLQLPISAAQDNLLQGEDALVTARLTVATADPTFALLHGTLTLRLVDVDRAAIVFDTSDLALGVPSSQLTRGPHPPTTVSYRVALSKANLSPVLVTLSDPKGVLSLSPSTLLFPATTASSSASFTVQVTVTTSLAVAPAPGVIDGTIQHTIANALGGWCFTVACFAVPAAWFVFCCRLL